MGTSGDVSQIAAPPSVELGALTSDKTIFVFDEQQCVPLAQAVSVDVSAPGKYSELEDVTGGTIAAGTLVSSHFVHIDSRHGQKGEPIFYNGTITVDADILGISFLTQALNGTDFLGAPGTAYPDTARKLNLKVRDYVIWGADNRTVTIHTGNHLHADQVRVITACTL